MFGPAMAAQFPRVTELAMSVSHEGVLGACDDDIEFAFGLDLILDGLERRAYKPSQVDLELAQDLVDRFVAAGAKVVYVGPSLDLKGPRKVVVPLVHHDDHIHVRIR